MSYKLSICIPVYNGYDKLKYTLNMLLTNLDATSVQVCVSDNGSSDKTQNLIQSLLPIHQNLKYFRFDINMGICKNFNNALEIGDGEYCWLLGDDDLPVFENIIDLLSIMEQNNFDVAIINPDAKMKLHSNIASRKIRNFDDYIENFSMISTWISTIIVKKSIVRTNPFLTTSNAFPHSIWLFDLLNKKYNFYWIGLPMVSESTVYQCRYDQNAIEIFATDLLDTIDGFTVQKQQIHQYKHVIEKTNLRLRNILGYRAKGGLKLASVKQNWSHIKQYSLCLRLKMLGVLLIPPSILKPLYSAYTKSKR